MRLIINEKIWIPEYKIEKIEYFIKLWCQKIIDIFL